MAVSAKPKHRSLWLQESVSVAPAAPLSGRAQTDIAIVGGGFVGLWTALRLKATEPSLDVTVIDADICGGGASGRNGGFVLSWWPKASTMVSLFGKDEALRLIRASEDAIGEMEEFCATYSPQSEFRRSGQLWTATSPQHDNAWQAVVDASKKLGEENAFTPLTPREVARLSGSHAHLSGVFEPLAATVHPGHLVRALRARALDLGVRIYENTPMKKLKRRGIPEIVTPGGSIQADRVILATNAWAAGIKELHTRIFVISSDMIATEPIPQRLEEIGWRNGPAITDSQTLVSYYRTTESGRVAFGKGGWSIGLGGWMPPAMEQNANRAGMVRRDFHRYYPMLRDVAITHDWAGPIDRTYNSLPIINWLNKDKTIAYGVGWSGNGVGPALVGAKILTSLALGHDDEWSRSGLVNAPAKHFPPDPIRYIGAHLVREGIVRKERSEALDLKPNPIAVGLSKLAPSGLEDKE